MVQSGLNSSLSLTYVCLSLSPTRKLEHKPLLKWSDICWLSGLYTHFWGLFFFFFLLFFGALPRHIEAPRLGAFADVVPRLGV